ncbi:WASH complex subunit 4 [Trichogramma pretiosum]|uniref:WASH complex subunit 4 n=1 Tax=Trichogramma pretiosum TaxID=7493 RepID=UPI0006C942C7|nr:WASH complex subunit 4 [Trichogramma pretiosum]
MIETSAWGSKNDSSIQKAIGAVHLKKYGKFFDFLADKSCPDNSLVEHVIEGPIRLIYQINEDVNVLSLCEMENAYYSKLLASICGIYKEVGLLREEANRFYINIINYGEPFLNNAVCRIEDLLEDLQNLSAYCNRIFTVIHLVVEQLANLANNTYREVYIPLLMENLMDLFIILVNLDELFNQSLILAKWRAYRVKVQTAIHNLHKSDIRLKKIFSYGKLLKDLQTQLLSNNLFINAINHILDVAKTNTMNDHLMCFLKNTLTDIENKIFDETLVKKSCIVVNIGLIVVSKLFGSCDKKYLKRLLEINKKVYAINLIGDIVWLPTSFLACHLPTENITSIPMLVGNKVLATKLQRLPLLVCNLSQRAIKWSIDIQKLQIEMGLEIFPELERKKELLLEILALSRQASESCIFITNLHGHLQKPMSRNTALLICRLFEVQKGLEKFFFAYAQTIVLAQSQVLQQLTYQMLVILESVRKSLTKNERIYKRERLDAIALLGASIRLVKGCASYERRLLLRSALICVSQLGDALRETELQQLRNQLEAYDAIADLEAKVFRGADYALLLRQHSLLPAYLEQVASNGSAGLGHVSQVLTALEVSEAGSSSSQLSRGGELRELQLERGLFEPCCRELETSLRLLALSHLRSPAKTKSVDSDRLVQAGPLALGRGALVCPRRRAELHLDTTFYALTLLAPRDWHVYRDMQQFARQRLGLGASRGLLPPRTTDPGPDALQLVRSPQQFATRFAYDLRGQVFVERASGERRQLEALGLSQAADGVRAHGRGIMATGVNCAYRFLRLRLHALSQLLFDEQVASRLRRELRALRSQQQSSTTTAAGGAKQLGYAYERAERLRRRPGPSGDGSAECWLARLRQLLSEIGNVLGLVRLLRSAGLLTCARSLLFLPEAEQTAALGPDCTDRSDSVTAASECLRIDLEQLARDLDEDRKYFKLLIDAFAPAFRDPARAQHLQLFHLAVPPLTLSYVDSTLANKEKLFKRGGEGAAFSDDGFAVGVAFLLALLDQNAVFDKLLWFQTLEQHLNYERSQADARIELEDEKLQQTHALTLKRLEEKSIEFKLLRYSLFGAKIFFQYPSS